MRVSRRGGIGILLLPLLMAVVLSGCGIYVGNVKFSAVEICSEELASRLHPNTGCLPPTRAENVQNFYLPRYRLPISNVEAAALEANPRPSNLKNLLPSFIGRGFNAKPSGSSSESIVWLAPETGDIEFLPTGTFGAPPELNIDTEVLYTTDLTGIVQKKLQVGVELNPSQIVDAALKLSGAPPLPGLSAALTDKLIKTGISRQSIDLGKGGYYYVSMLPSTLDSLTYALSLCGWRVDQPNMRQRSETTGAVVYSSSDGTVDPAADCTKTLSGHKNVAPSVISLLAALEESAKAKRGSNVIGIVVGVAVVRTERGTSELCSKSDIGLVASGASSSLSMASCQELRDALRDFKVAGSVIPSSGNALPPQATTLSDDQKKNILIALNAEVAKAVYKTLDIGDHSSVLAIHWIPARFRR